MQNVMSMSRFVSLLLVTLVVMAVSPCFSGEKEFKGQGRQTIEKFKKTSPEMTKFFNSAYGYAVFPTVGKGGFGIGAARGRGLVYERGTVVGETILTQVTIGLQLGGQTYSEVVFLENKATMNSFKRGNFALSAQASAVAAASGASANAKYKQGVAVFTMANSGVLYEASVGGQQCQFIPPEM